MSENSFTFLYWKTTISKKQNHLHCQTDENGRETVGCSNILLNNPISVMKKVDLIKNISFLIDCPVLPDLLIDRSYFFNTLEMIYCVKQTNRLTLKLLK